MPSPDPDSLERQLLERLLTDPSLRLAFRHDPVRTCHELGFDDLADAFAGPRSMQTLEIRESKSSLAGVVMAVAAEAIAVGEVQGLLRSDGESAATGLAAHHVRAPAPPKEAGRALPHGGAQPPTAPGPAARLCPRRRVLTPARRGAPTRIRGRAPLRRRARAPPSPARRLRAPNPVPVGLAVLLTRSSQRCWPTHA